MVKPIATVTMLAILQLAACKLPNQHPNGAQTKNLQDLTAIGGVAAPDYRCGLSSTSANALPSYIEPLRNRIDEPASSKSLKDVVLATAAALPAPIAQLMVLSKTKISLVADASLTCSKVALSNAQRQVRGGGEGFKACWYQNSADAPVLVMQADAAVIRHSFVRLGSYFFSEYLMNRVISGQGPALLLTPQWRKAASDFKLARAKIAAALLADLGNYDESTLARFQQLNTIDPQAFGNLAVAEAQDSYYCGAASRTAFASLFRQTYAVFSDQNDPQSMVSMFGAR